MAREKIIPKQIGGVKVPKALRKLGDRVLADPRAREMAATALLALGAAIVQRGTGKASPAREAFEHPAEAAQAARDAASGAARKGAEAAGAVADAVAQAVGEAFDAIRRDVARKIRPVRPRHAHDDPEEEAGEDRMH